MKSIVIFGGAGFVGKHILGRISKLGYKIIVPYQKSIQEAKIRLLGVTGQIIPFRFSHQKHIFLVVLSSQGLPAAPKSSF